VKRNKKNRVVVFTDSPIDKRGKIFHFSHLSFFRNKEQKQQRTCQTPKKNTHPHMQFNNRKTLLLLLCSAIFVGLTFGQSAEVTSKTYGTRRVEIGDADTPDSALFDAVVFTVQFNDSIYVNGTSTAELSLSIPPRSLNGEDYLPPAVIHLFGSMQLICPCTTCNTTKYDECDGTDCTYESLLVGTPTTVPQYAIPLPSVNEPIFVLFSILAGDYVPTAEGVEGKLVLVKVQRNYNFATGEWEDTIPPEINPANCTVHFLGQADVDGDHYLSYDAAGAEELDMSVTDFTEEDLECNFTKFEEDVDAMFAAVSDTNDHSLDKGSLQSYIWKIGAYTQRDSWIACINMVESLTVKDTVNRTIVGDKVCRDEPGSEAYLANPCCSADAALEQCCVPAEVIVEEETYSGVNLANLIKACDDDNHAISSVRSYIVNAFVAEKCDTQTKSAGFDFNAWENLLNFADVCSELVLGTADSKPFCASDEECYTSCDLEEGTCVIPYDNPEPALIACFADKMDARLERHLRRMWGLTGSTNETEFAEALSTELQDTGCSGPESWEYRAKKEVEEVADCDGESEEHCWCFTSYDDGSKRSHLSGQRHGMRGDHLRLKYHHAYQAASKRDGRKTVHSVHHLAKQHKNPRHRFYSAVHHSASQVNSRSIAARGTYTPTKTCLKEVFTAENETGCLGVNKCNWDITAADSTACLGGEDNATVGFCGECHGKLCWVKTVQPTCYRRLANMTTCTELAGGAVASWNEYICEFASNTTIDSCIEPTLCPEYDSSSTTAWMDTDVTCGYFCYSTNVTSALECAAVNDTDDAVWDTDVKTGDGVCKFADATNPVLCAALSGDKSAAWHDVVTWRKGRFTTQDECEDGECNVDIRMNSTQCEAATGCTFRCPKCVPQYTYQTLCYTEGGSSDECDDLQGEYNSTTTICRLNYINNETVCTALTNGTFETCESLNATTCDLCNDGDDSCPVQQSILGCRVSYNERCSNESECTNNGICSDWELRNYGDTFCQSTDNFHRNNCTGVCVFPFETEHGHVSCGEDKTKINIGCKSLSIDNNVTCDNQNGTWIYKARDQDECEAHGFGCREQRFWWFTGKDEANCTDCNGDYVPFYHWTSGSWAGGEIHNLTWTTKQWLPINEWQPTINWTKLDEAAEVVIAELMSSHVKSQFLCKHGPKATVVSRLACSCGDVKGDDCFTELDFSEVGEADSFNGLAASFEWHVAKVSHSNESVATDFTTIEVDILSDITPLLRSFSGGAHRSDVRSYSKNGIIPFASLAKDRTEYEVVYNNLGGIVGQLVGTGVTITIGNATDITLCIDRDYDITLEESYYPVADLGLLNDEDLIIPLGQNATVVDGQLCTNISETGTYFPIYRVVDWEDVLPGKRHGMSIAALIVLIVMLSLAVLGLVAIATGAYFNSSSNPGGYQRVSGGRGSSYGGSHKDYGTHINSSPNYRKSRGGLHDY
jgi:hypothetical protein